jgi:mono/diheme cytochrome c family protein
MLIRVMALTGVLVLAGYAGAMSVAPGQTRPPREDYQSGAYLYKTFCASCHGDHGRGDGPAADLTTPRAPDLSLLQRKGGGTFPRAQVMAILEGSTPQAGHDTAMPNWRNVLLRDARNDEGAYRKRLDALVSHLESLQAR